MRDNHEVRTPVEKITDSEVSAIIRYLDPSPASDITGLGDGTVIAVVICLSLLLPAALAFLSLYLRTS